MKRCIVFFAVFLLGFLLVSGCSSLDAENRKLDEHYKTLYYSGIHDAGKIEVDGIVNNTSYLKKDPKRLTLIAYLITSNFTNPNWQYQRDEEHFCYYPQANYYNYCCALAADNISLVKELSFNECHYMHDKSGRIRQFYGVYGNGVVLNVDPYWIAFQKTGECQELSVLFNKTANESGFVTRIVRSDGIGHFWNEVYVDGDWKFLDVQRYGMKDTDNSSKWFGNTSDYAEAYPWTTLCDLINNGTHPGIFVFDINTGGYGENRNQAYDPFNSCAK
jgi:hypothetical protein